MIMENFELIASLKADGNVPFNKYRSKETGLIVCIAEVAGPIVTGYLCLATEAHDDDGLPHTLEHLIFMGSEQYPYKGMLDLLANRCLASGTNAWTDTDHTCYTMTTAGAEGLLNLLPIYLDHILFPTLTDAAFVTEVHHINGQGEDAGVVYCEMQARENMGESLCHLNTIRALYPGHCGYKSETGGLMKNLRESTNNEAIHAYHKKFYRSDNVCIIITGQCEPKDVFKALESMEKKLIERRPSEEFIRPWRTEVPPLTSSVDQVVPYPCDETTHGLVYMAWRGPKASDFNELMSIFTLMEYLTYSSVSPLQQEFVETTDPFCSKIGFSVNENFVSCVYLTFNNVPLNKLNDIKDKLMSILSNMCNVDKEFDMDRMKTIIHRRRLNILSQMECTPHDSIALNIIGDFLYGDDVKDLKQRIQHIPIIENMATQPADYWLQLLRDYLVDAPLVVTIGEPDCIQMLEMGQSEKERIEQQRLDLGDEGLTAKQKILEKSLDLNDLDPPEGVLTSVPVPSIDSIYFHSITRSSNYTGDTNPTFPMEKFPFRFMFDSIQSSFVEISVMMDTRDLPDELRLYLPIFLQLITESPIRQGDEIIPYESVVKELAADTVHYYANLGLEEASKFSCGSFAQMCTLYLKVEVEKYEKGIQWLSDILYNTEFTPSRIYIIANKMINDVSQRRREGIKVANTLLRNLTYIPKSNHWNTSMFRQHNFLKNLLNMLEENKDKVLDVFNKTRSILSSAENITVHMAANAQTLLQKYEDPSGPWSEFIYSLPKSAAQTDEVKEVMWRAVQWDNELFINDSERTLPRASVIGVGSVESSYLIQTVPSINDYKDPDLAPLLVFLQYLTQLEGPLWRNLRGQGLAYSYSMTLESSKGILYLILARCTHVAAAYAEAKRIILSHSDNSAEWDNDLLESARSSLVYEIVEREKSVSDMSLQSRLGYFRGTNMEYTKELLCLISKVTLKDVQKIGPKYVQAMFDSSKSLCAICCNPSKIEELTKVFKDMGRDLSVVGPIENSFISSY